MTYRVPEAGERLEVRPDGDSLSAAVLGTPDVPDPARVPEQPWHVKMWTTLRGWFKLALALAVGVALGRLLR